MATGLSAGSTKILGLAEAGQLSTKAADVVEGSSSLLKVTKHTDDVMDAINLGKDVVTGYVQSLVMDAGMAGLSAVIKARNNTTVKTGGGSVNSDYQNYVARKKANGESYLSEADWTQKVSTLSANTVAYSDFKASALESFKETATDVESNITIETRNTAGNVRIQDYTTAADGLSVNRQSLLDDLSKYRGTVVGDGKGAFTGGTKIKPGTQIDVVSKQTENHIISVNKASDFSDSWKKLQDTFPDSKLSQTKIDDIVNMEPGTRLEPESYLDEQYISEHNALFDDGVAAFAKGDYWIKKEGYFGRSDGAFVFPKNVAEAMLKEANGNPRVLEQLLGLDEGSLGDAPIMIEPQEVENLRIPSGNESGSKLNPQWCTGGKTYPRGVPESVIDRVSRDKLIIRQITE